MITRTFISKSNSIYKNSDANYGLNPIGLIHYGNLLSRAMIYFDTTELEKLVADGTYKINSALTHTLKLTNCGSLKPTEINQKIYSHDSNGVKERATSFDIILFTVPRTWDAGTGFDNAEDIWFNEKTSFSSNGCNWYNNANGSPWEIYDGKGEKIGNTTEGIYSTEFLSKEYDKFSELKLGTAESGTTSVIIARQHFDSGAENFEFDITDHVNKIIAGEAKNNGLALAFSPLLEETTTRYSQYVGFFTQNTNTFYKPVLETRYNIITKDDRYRFYLGKTNRLYLNAYVNGELVELDEIPTCKINDTEYAVKEDTKGLYYAEVKLSAKDYEADTILYDVWSNLKYNGETIDDVEMQFATLSSGDYFSFGETAIEPKSLNVVLSGIDDDEKLIQGEKRNIKAIFKVPYTSSEYDLVDNAQYRLYVKDGNREVDVIEWDNIELMNKFNYFNIDTTTLIPNTYYIDIKLKLGNEIRNFKKSLTFKVISNITKQER